MGLVARALEAAGVPTLCLTAAHSITAAANPPRAAFVDLTIVDTGVRWSDDESWKHTASSGLNNGVVSGEGDTRSERTPDPQYQYESDRLAAEGA